MTIQQDSQWLLQQWLLRYDAITPHRASRVQAQRDAQRHSGGTRRSTDSGERIGLRDISPSSKEVPIGCEVRFTTALGKGERGNGALNEEALLRRYATTRDPVLKQELVRRLLPLARSLALRYRGSPEPLEDLIQVASLGLVKALDGFDPERGKSFPAYAAPTILGELRRHFSDRVWELRLPRVLQERTMAVREAAAELTEELGRTPTVSQIAERLELSEEEVLEALQAD